MYHGKQRGVDPKQLSRYACVLTTYTTMAMEAASKQDLKQGSSVSQPDELPDSDQEDSTAALPGNMLHSQLRATAPRLSLCCLHIALVCQLLAAFTDLPKRVDCVSRL